MSIPADDEPDRYELPIGRDPPPRGIRPLLELRSIEASTRSALRTFADDDHERRSAVVERALLLLARLRRRTRDLPDAAEQAEIETLIAEARSWLRSERMG